MSYPARVEGLVNMNNFKRFSIKRNFQIEWYHVHLITYLFCFFPLPVFPRGEKNWYLQQIQCRTNPKRYWKSLRGKRHISEVSLVCILSITKQVASLQTIRSDRKSVFFVFFCRIISSAFSPGYVDDKEITNIACIGRDGSNVLGLIYKRGLVISSFVEVALIKSD